jgi:hypothetical protein
MLLRAAEVSLPSVAAVVVVVPLINWLSASHFMLSASSGVLMVMLLMVASGISLRGV